MNPNCFLSFKSSAVASGRGVHRPPLCPSPLHSFGSGAGSGQRLVALTDNLVKALRGLTLCFLLFLFIGKAWLLPLPISRSAYACPIRSLRSSQEGNDRAATKQYIKPLTAFAHCYICLQRPQGTHKYSLSVRWLLYCVGLRFARQTALVPRMICLSHTPNQPHTLPS